MQYTATLVCSKHKRCRDKMCCWWISKVYKIQFRHVFVGFGILQRLVTWQVVANSGKLSIHPPHRDVARSGVKSRKQAGICFAVLWPLSVTISILHMYKHIVLHLLWCLLAEYSLFFVGGGVNFIGFEIHFCKWWTLEFNRSTTPHPISLLNPGSAVPQFIVHTLKPDLKRHTERLHELK